MDIKFGFTSASKNVGNKDENGSMMEWIRLSKERN